ncbi:ROK family transcriptional regulator [Caviibacter abscessus]|uniref:ROK family transcriptional regulator n=1 Tax=Caviibacter abscessus TaxID=1766719 RepID=UPI000837F363|nr:ROK family transcriptional regulator [Caviibacter abscessus]
MKENNKLRTNDYILLNAVFENGDMTALELAKKLDVTPAAISKTLKKLKQRNYIIEDEPKKGTGRGRPRNVIKINGDFKNIIGVNFGADFIDICIGTLNGEIIESRRKKFFLKTQESLVNLLISELDEYINKYKKESIIGIGLALNGVSDVKKRIAKFSPYFKWKNLKIGELLEDRYNLPVVIDNDVRAMLNAERMIGNAKNKSNVFYIYMKNGIGGAMIINGNMYYGSNSQAGEVGHFIINKHSNFVCKCGKTGCLEAEFSEKSIKLMIISEYEKSTLTSFDNNYTIKQIYEKAKDDPFIMQTVSVVSYKIGEAIGNLMNVLDIGDVIVSGDIIYSGNVFLENFQKGINSSLTYDFGSKIRVHITKLGDNVEKYGALSLIMSNLFSNLKLIK